MSSTDQLSRRLLFRFSKNFSRAVIALVILVPAVARSQSNPAPRTDNQVWTETQLALPINSKIDFVIAGVVRFGRDVSRPVNERVGAGVSFKMGKYLTVFPFYLHVEIQPTPTNHNSEERLALEATGKFPAGKFLILDRNRFEFHYPKRGPNFQQYRNRLQLEHPLGFHGLEGFTADEVFYDSLANAWIRNRAYIGLIKKVNKHFTFELYFVRQNDGRSHPGDINAIGATFKLRR